MKRYGFLFIIVFIISSLFFINGIYGYIVSTDTSTNYFSIKNTTSYTVIHQKMNLDGTTYTVVDEDTIHVDNVPLGTTITPLTNEYEGFITPGVQEVTLNTFGPHIIVYSYDREVCHLTINDSNYVTGNSSGDYLYGTTIHLVADEYNSGNFPFAQWSNGELSRDYTFTITDDTTIGPVYAVSYQVNFVTNNNDTIPTRVVFDGDAVGSIPTLVKETCELNGTGSYYDRHCTEGYKFEGWYTEPTFVNEVNGDYVPTQNTTLYAKWTKVYFHKDEEVFNNDHLIDTDIALFSEENIHRDFIASFIVSSVGNLDDRDVIFADMYEKKDPYPGVNFRWYQNSFNVNVNVTSRNNRAVNYLIGNKVIIKREKGKIYYSLDGSNFTQYQDFSNFTSYFDITATFGANRDGNGNPWRFFTGTLTDMTLELIDQASYTIHYDQNGGTGMMTDQNAEIDKTVNLKKNVFTKDGYSFAGWNTQPDGSGTNFLDEEQVSNLGSNGDVVTLYAQWDKIKYYYIHFDGGNAATGSMPDQRILFGQSTPLDTFAFNYPGYYFVGWNTQPDGSGTSYKDGVSVINLTNVEDDVITLYAQYMHIEYQNDGPVSFDGSSYYIDTGVNLYTSDTKNKDFIIRFTADYVSPDNATNNQDQATLFNCKDESNPKWPGFVVRLPENASNQIKTYAKWDNTNGSKTISTIASNRVPVTFEFRRVNKVVYYSYSYQGFTSEEVELYNQDDWTLTSDFADNITFGASIDANHQPFRYFEGTLSNMLILTK